jgi:hypothetical protein
MISPVLLTSVDSTSRSARTDAAKPFGAVTSGSQGHPGGPLTEALVCCITRRKWEKRVNEVKKGAVEAACCYRGEQHDCERPDTGESHATNADTREVSAGPQPEQDA